MECWKTTCTACQSSAFDKDWWLVHSISKTNYGTIIQIFLLSLLLEENKWDCWFQQFEVTTHTVKTTAAFLWDFFSDHIVGHGLWPPWSPDLMQPDFFLWRFLKERVYSYNPRSLEDLKRNTKQALAGSYQLILQKDAKKKKLWKGWMLIFKKVWNIFSICFNITVLVSLKNKNTTMNGLQYWVVFYLVYPIF